MNNKYNEIMDRVKVDAEMRERILRALEEESQEESGNERLRRDESGNEGSRQDENGNDRPRQDENGNDRLRQDLIVEEEKVEEEKVEYKKGEKNSEEKNRDDSLSDAENLEEKQEFDSQKELRESKDTKKKPGNRRLSFFGRMNRISTAIAAMLALVLIGSGVAYVTSKSGHNMSMDSAMMAEETTMEAAAEATEEAADEATNQAVLGEAGEADTAATGETGTTGETTGKAEAADETDELKEGILGGTATGGADEKAVVVGAAAEETTAEEAAPEEAAADDAFNNATTADGATSQEATDTTADKANGVGADSVVSLAGGSEVSVDELIGMVSGKASDYVQGSNAGTSSETITARLAGYDGEIYLEWKNNVIKKVVWTGVDSGVSSEELAELITTEVGEAGKKNRETGDYSWSMNGKKVVLRSDLAIEVTIE